MAANFKEIIINSTEFLTAFLNIVDANEIADPIYAEGFAGYYKIAEYAHHHHIKKLLTGYGADLIFGDLTNFDDQSKVNEYSAYWCKRTENWRIGPSASQPFQEILAFLAPSVWKTSTMMAIWMSFV